MIDYSTNGDFVVLKLNDPPLNILTFDMLNALISAIERANDDQSISGIIITGTSDHFSAGADVNMFKAIASDEEATILSRRFQETFNKIEQSSKPIVAALGGSVMGGALECALAAHFRVCTATTRCSLPEVTLGIVPGAGGTQRLPRCIGPEAALRMLLSGKPVSAQEAQTLGLVDAVCEPSDLILSAQKLLQSAPPLTKNSERTDNITDGDANEKAWDQAKKIITKIHPEIIAPSMILEAVQTGIDNSYEAGLEKERNGFTRCLATIPTRNKIRHFFACKETGKIADLKSILPVGINSAAVIGMGTMGSGIAQAIATAGKKVVVLDTDTEIAQKGIARIAESFERKVSRGTVTRKKADAILQRISIADEWSALASVDIVIEAAFEDIAVKQSIVEKIAVTCPSTTIIASNTSTIDLDILAEKLHHPGSLIGLHFFNPAHSMPLVEVIQRRGSDPEAVAAAMAFAKELRKTPVLVNNSVGFVVNRLFIPYCIEAYQLLEEGADPFEIDAAMVDFGCAMGPLASIDMTGVDILVLTDKQLQAAFPYHLPLSIIASTLVDEGMLGQKTGCGVYKYEKGERTPKKSDRTEEIIKNIRNESGRKPKVFSREEIIQRCTMRLVSEGFRIVEEKIALREEHIDVAMVLGTGFPDFRGGVLKYARDSGLKKVFSQLETLATSCGERYRPCNYLQSIIQE